MNYLNFRIKILPSLNMESDCIRKGELVSGKLRVSC